MKKIPGYLLYVLAIAAIVAGCQKKSTMPNMRETYARKDKNPFGTYIAHRQIESMFYKNSLREKRQAFNKTWAEISDNEALYICITNNLFVNTSEVNSMLDYVSKGNDLFLSAAYFDNNLLKKAGVMQRSHLFYALPDIDSMRMTSTSFQTNPYRYFYMPFYSYFSVTDSALIKPIGFNEKGKPNCIVIFHGKGKLFLHCEPRAFSNYFLLQKKNYQYLQQILAYTHNDPEHLYWDDYYHTLDKRRQQAGSDEDNSSGSNSGSSLDELFKHPPLKIAFWLLLALIVLYILFELKRRQRIIPPVKPNVNTSVAFTETIGRLYLQKKDNKNIAEKMCTYFNEYIRNNYFLNTSQINDDFITTLSRKSGVDRNRVEILYRAMQQAQNKNEVSDYELLSLNEQIQKFYKK